MTQSERPITLLTESPPLVMANSRQTIERFPFPFTRDQFGYSVNVRPAAQGSPGSFDEFLFDIDETYQVETAERERILSLDHARRYIAFPHMIDAQWDFLELGMTSLAADYPQSFELTRNGDQWHWRNRLLNLEHSFTFGDATTLPQEPLEYLGRQMQGDFCLLDQRDNDLYLDAGLVTFPADWSLAFNIGMTFEHWHGPVPLAHEAGIFNRAKRFIMNLQPDDPWLRLNWSITINRRLDTSPEISHLWGPDRSTVTIKNAGSIVHLRVEVQTLTRLSRSHAVLFTIRTYLISLDDLATHPEWAERFRRVLLSLPDEIIEYKGLTRFRDTIINWLGSR